MSISFGDRVHILTKDPQLAYLDNHIATITHSDRRGYYLQVDGMKPAVHLSNLQGMQCLNRLTSAQESVLDLPSQVYDPDLGWQDLPKSIPSAPTYSNLDTPESPTMVTSNNSRKRGRPRKVLLSELVLSEAEVAEVSILSVPAQPVNPSPIKETASDNKTPEIVYPTSEKSLKKSNLRTGRSKTSPAYSQSIGETILDSQSSTGLTTAGMMSNGSLLAADILEAPILEKDFLYLESPGALGEGISGANPPGQTKLEGQLKQNGSIAPGEVSNPEFLEVSLGLPIGWTDPQEEATATELLAAIAPPATEEKPSETSLTPELQASQSIVSSTTIPKHSTRTGIFAPESPKQLDLTSRIAWVYVDQIEEVSCTQIRHSVDGEAIARYAELMRDNLWDFQRHPLPVLFEHENRYLIGDGHHRIEAARKHKVQIKCEIFTAWTIDDAVLYSIKAVENSNHGIPLRPKDQRKRITMLLDLLDRVLIAPPDGYNEWSARAIAHYLRLPESGYRTVASIRRERTRATEEDGDNTSGAINTTSDTTTPPPFSKGEATPTILQERGNAAATTETTTPLLTIDDTETETPTPPLTDEQKKALGHLTSVDQRVLSVINTIETLEDRHLIILREAIESEEARRIKVKNK
ncbi:hypothetical protein QUA70_19760 [Microcoleus sp. LAD1_D5]